MFFFRVKLFPDLKCVGWLKLTVKYLKLLTLPRRFYSWPSFDPIGHLRDFSHAYAFFYIFNKKSQIGQMLSNYDSNYTSKWSVRQKKNFDEKFSKKFRKKIKFSKVILKSHKIVLSCSNRLAAFLRTYFYTFKLLARCTAKY